MKILHVIDTLSPAKGGPPQAVRLLIKAYATVGCHVELVCLDNPDAPFLRGVGCPIHALNQSYLGRYALSPRLWQWLHEHAAEYEGIVMNGIWSFPGVAIYFATRKAGPRYGIFTHGALDPWFNRVYPLKYIKKLIYWPLQYTVLRNATAVFFTADAERDLAKKSFSPNRWNSVVVPYGINDPDEEGTDPHGQIEAFHDRFPELRGRRYLLFLGRIHPKKGCDLLIEAFAKVADAAPEVDLVIAGPDQVGMAARLKNRAAELGVGPRVHWPGIIGGDHKWGALRACDAFVLPSHQENFGISVVEALAVGRPVLISNQVNIYKQIEDDGVGMVEDDSLSGTLRLLRRWVDLHSGEREAMASRARPCFLQRFTMSRAAAVINAHFDSAPNRELHSTVRSS